MVTQSGCQIFQRFRSSQPRIPVAFEQAPSGEQLVSHLNSRAAQVRQLKTNVRVSMDGIPTLRGTLAVERPNRLRLKAGLMGVSEMGVDVGSNDDVFWIWTRASLPGETPALYYSTHEGYRRSAIQNALPIEPAWLIDSLGLVEFLPGDRHEGPFPREDGRVEIRTYRNSSSGSGIRTCVIDPRTGVVVQQSIYDASGRRIAYVNSTSYKPYPELGISLPHQMVLNVDQPGTGQTLSLVVDAEDFELNALYGDSARLFGMPQPSDIPLIDISKAVAPDSGTTRPVAVQPQQGYLPPASRSFARGTYAPVNNDPANQGPANRGPVVAQWQPVSSPAPQQR